MGSRKAAWLLSREARALLTRLDGLVPFAMLEPVLPAAALPPQTLVAIESYLEKGRRELRRRVQRYLAWLASRAHAAMSPTEMHQRYVMLRLRFNIVLSQFDLFADAVTQRGENGTGVRLAALEIAALDALTLPGVEMQPPPLLCYLDRGPGGAIRRARTRLPGGDENPVAVIRMPRERMIGAGLASSLAHEVGHQGAALLDLVKSIRPILIGLQHQGGEESIAWRLWERWISEILADLWAVARVSTTATLGLMGVVSIPRAFQFRLDASDPHPMPAIRVKLSCALGNALYPDRRWQALARQWDAFYPLDGIDGERRRVIGLLLQTMPALVALLVHHRPRSLKGRSLGEVLSAPERHPERLLAWFGRIRGDRQKLSSAPPTLALAAVGQARADGWLSPEQESRLLAQLLPQWALRRTNETALRAAA